MEQNASYVVQCWTCLGEFDALDSVWCSCDPRNPSRLCQFCLQCFCGASEDYKANFWKTAPDQLRKEVSILREAKGKLGEMLIRSNLLTTDQLIKAIEFQKLRGCKLGEALVGLGFVSEKDIDYFLNRQDTVNTTTLADFVPNRDLFRKLPPQFCYEKLVVPMALDRVKDDLILTVAFADPKDVNLIDLVQTKTDAKIIPYQAAPDRVRAVLEAHFSEKELRPQEEAVVDVKKIAQNLLVGGIKNRASDFSVEPKEDAIHVSYRIDGILFKHKPLAASMRDSLVAEFRGMAGLSPKGSGAIETGRTVAKHGGKKYEVNIQCFPAPYGESLSVKIIDREEFLKDLDVLGLAPDDLRKVKKTFSRAAGVVLVTGPIMNGTITTGYSCVRFLASRGRKTATVESPVYTPLEDVQQVQVAGGQFAGALQSLLSTYPEAVFLAGLPDEETASLAFRAGAKIFVGAAVESPSAGEAIDALLALGVAPRTLASSLSLVLNQRLVRRICAACRKEAKTQPSHLQRAGLSPQEAAAIKTFAGEGCDKCHHTGYAGRAPLFEALEWTPELGKLLEQGASGRAIVQKAVQVGGMATLRRRCLELVHQGVTTVEEFEKNKF